MRKKWLVLVGCQSGHDYGLYFQRYLDDEIAHSYTKCNGFLIIGNR